MKNVLITGANGLVGRALSQKLTKKGYLIKQLSRNKPKNALFPNYLWNVEKSFIEEEALENLDAIIHLAGEPIFSRRWTESQKQKILASRERSTQLLFEKVSRISPKPKAFICASAIGYYGNGIGSKPLGEEDSSGDDFLAKVCKRWETKAALFSTLGIRSVQIRTSMVLSSEGGALKKLGKMIRFYLGTSFGSGKQYFPWIHLQDLVGFYVEALENNAWHGPYNAASGEHITNRDFIKKVATKLNRPIFLPSIPGFILKMMLLEASGVLLGGNPISCDKALNQGFKFKYPTLQEALEDIYQK